ncbi:phenylacetate--CoA ligase PaaK [Marinactinospora thermotolerans]|uniref:Phenylacetate-coenzyme A ligase n=1 Tax=Marinactinospora thermotolerans DSM 45154 TaxID=1122192 RepID=A0A1T4TAD1_9ACTN|nr:phenylacetate--CoA ligase PaaK [Marinactinospora thermotolerans]SKA37346.1 phenylacetate-CoA ligase [Marinactinospora thermotolerans DSM 45154]
MTEQATPRAVVPPLPRPAPAAGGADPLETAPPEVLREHQLRLLRRTLRRAYDAQPFYRRKCEAAGVVPEDCRELDDIARFPFTTKQDLRDAYPFDAFAVPMDQVARVHASSGTTGQATVVGYTRGDLETWAELVARCIRAAGGRPGEKVHVAYGYGLFTGGLGAHYGAERLGCTVIPMSGGQTARQVQLIQDLRPETIMVTPSYLLTIADEFRRQGIDPRTTSLRTAILGAEPWTEDMRAEIEETFALDAVDIYGLSEVLGPGVAGECVETKDGPHVWEDHFLPEIVDPLGDTPLPDGQTGELVFTSLTKEALPIVRYRTRDLSRLLPGTARPSMRRMGRVAGRSDDMLIVRGVNLFPSQIEELVLRVPALAPHFQLVLTRPDRMDELTVRVEHRPDAGDADAAGPALRHAIKEHLGVTADVEVVAPQTLERSVGKLRRVVDHRHR